MPRFSGVVLALLAGWISANGHGGSLPASPAADSAVLEISANAHKLMLELPDRGGAHGAVREFPAEALAGDAGGVVVWEGKLDGGRIEIDRFDGVRERIYSVFRLEDEAGDAIGAPVWTTDFATAATFSFPNPATKKGLNSVVMLEDAVELGAGHVVENIAAGSILDLDAPDPELFQVVDGRKIGFKTAAVRRLDERLLGYRRAGMNAIGILINPKWSAGGSGSPLFPARAEPDGDHVKLLAFNHETPEGILVYRAIVEFLAERYTRPDGRHGWLSGLIIGNEIQAHWVWHNQGEAEPEAVLDDYLLSMRLADIAGRSRHPDFRVFASMTHHWTEPGDDNPKRGLRGDWMLQYLNTRSKEGGDFPWGVAFHPYPENLFRPAFWNDRSAFHSFDTPRITMKNIEVLDAFLARPEMKTDGRMREIILSEQGFHGPAGEEGETLQAAALARALEKAGRLPSIRAFHLHRHVDHPHEGGLLLGLWTHAGSGVQPGTRKRAWEVYRAFGTSDWTRINEPLLAIAGLASWEETAPVSRDEITEKRVVRLPEGVVADLTHQLGEAKVINAADFRSDVFLKDGSPVDSIFHHPPGNGSSRARFKVQLPETEDRAGPVFAFGTGLSAPSVSGVIFRVAVNGDRLIEHHHTEQSFTPHEINLSRWAGEEIELELEVDGNGSTAHDWAHWVEPRIWLGSEGGGNEKSFRALVFSYTTGFRHKSIPEGIAAVKKLGREHRFSVDATEDPAWFTGDRLRSYDVVIFMNTNGTLFTEEQRAALQEFIQAGGGYVGVHSAAATEYEWDWYRRLVGAHFRNHPKVQPAVIVVEDKDHVSTRHLPDRWERVDEWYNYRTNPREEVDVLLSLDTASYEGSGMPDDHPIAWYREFDGGRTWYTGLGHTKEAYEEPAFLKHLLGGILWAAGKTEDTP